MARPSSRTKLARFLRRMQNNKFAIILLFLLLILLYKLNTSSRSSNFEASIATSKENQFSQIPPIAKDFRTPYINPQRVSNRKELDELIRLERQQQHQRTNLNRENKQSSCPNYSQYSSTSHPPFSKGPLELPFQRPLKECRTFSSSEVERVISDITSRISDPDLSRLFENCFPNTLDTTIRWHHPGVDPQTFIVTGDIDASWLRDSHKQITVYSHLANFDPKIRDLILGTISTQSDYVISHPYCNAFHPPSQSGLKFPYNNENDIVFPRVNLNIVFECKYEIDSLASFLGISNDYYEATYDTSFITASWLKALSRLLRVLQEQAIPTYSETGQKLPNYYTFRRKTDTGTETLNLGGAGNPVNRNTSLIRSAFRPSDDATIYQFFIPGNAFMSVELKRTAKILNTLDHIELAKKLSALGVDIENGIFQHGTYDHPEFGKVFAYEIDGYGSISIMDDANTPSLLSLPDMGFVSRSNEIYLNTRKMILSKTGNPYYLKGEFFEGIGGPHIGTRFAWPMSHIIAIRTTDNDTEIKQSLEILKKSTSGLGLMHESVNVDLPHSFTRSWFAWCNSEFAKTILDLAERKPHLIFSSDDSSPYTIKAQSPNRFIQSLEESRSKNMDIEIRNDKNGNSMSISHISNLASVSEPFAKSSSALESLHTSLSSVSPTPSSVLTISLSSQTT
ncbi:uncharacterized protein SAPINGB_P005681 [Magnusiomyces paraingens]|uniref:Glycoside hydrolase family 125 protein n=1 Tax=Magnusiomyces paraingens TaxID=2606893 RepID=A0A5E8C0L5_9ASCO|nr:uncharacterized protein SAPINGB_P005681 [Saprochaete ingens]VVT57409.1 unnamed protein product [Saprochaete ingens]